MSNPSLPARPAGTSVAKRLVYPGQCAKCGRGWGDHLTDFALRTINPRACRFQPLPGEIERPTLEDSTHAR